VTILGLDPGRRTGYAVVAADGSLVEGGSFGWGEWTELERLFVLPVEVVVVEAFCLYRHKAGSQIGSEFEPAQVIGAVRYLVDRANRRNSDAPLRVALRFQPASVIHCGERRLSPHVQRLVDQTDGSAELDRHARDALGHALYYRQSTEEGRSMRGGSFQRRLRPK